jgi:hypothetical protein
LSRAIPTSDEVARRLDIALRAAGAVHDDLDALHRGLDAVAREEVARHEPDALLVGQAPPGEHPDVAAGPSKRATTYRPSVPVPPVTKMVDVMAPPHAR